MALLSRLFTRGIQPLSRKEITRKKPLMPLSHPPSYIILPLRSPNGALVNPIVKQGDKVMLGQQVAMPSHEEAVPLFSGISGRVHAISQQPHPTFGLTRCLVIENDFKDTPYQYPPHVDFEELTQEQVIVLLRDRGLQGMSKDTRGVHSMVMEGRGKIDCLIVNACEAEPYLSADHRLLLERQETVIAGSKLLAYAMGAEKIILVVQGDKLDATEELEKADSWDDSIMSILTLPSKYPLGEDKQVIALVTGKELSPNEPNHKAHCGIFHVGTVNAVGEGILKGLPQTHRAVTVAGACMGRKRNFWLPIGTPLECLLENVEGFRAEPVALLLGGPMSGISIKKLQVPILVNSSGFLALSKEEVPKHLHKLTKVKTEYPCIHCGHCVNVCPQRLRPYLVYQTMLDPRKTKLAQLHPEDCISCGCCNYRCPAKLPLAQRMQEAKELVREFTPVEAEGDVKIYDPKKDKIRLPKRGKDKKKNQGKSKTGEKKVITKVSSLKKNQVIHSETEQRKEKDFEEAKKLVDKLQEEAVKQDTGAELLEEENVVVPKPETDLDREESASSLEEVTKLESEEIEESVEIAEEIEEAVEIAEKIEENVEIVEKIEETVEIVEEIEEAIELSEEIEETVEIEEKIEETVEIAEEIEEAVEIEEQAVELSEETEKIEEVAEALTEETKQKIPKSIHEIGGKL